MDRIDASAPEHSAAINKILDLARWPHHCLVTRRATEDMVRLRLTKEAVLIALREHVNAGKPIYHIKQETTDLGAYVLLPCAVETHELYLKVQLPHAASETQEKLIIISSHPPLYPPKGQSNEGH